MKKQPQITEQTRRNLMNSFWNMYKSEDTSRITIGKICMNANYERTTFYRYFTDITDILDKLEDELITGIKASIINGMPNNNVGIITNKFKSFSDIYGEYITIFHEKGNVSFYKKFKELVKDDVFEYFNMNIKNESQKDIVFEFMFSSLINSYTYWYRHQKSMSLDTFVKFANSMLLNGIESIIVSK